MSDTVMTIREMCETFDVTPRTLRFYESKELLSPIRQGQKRLFTRRERARLTLILRGKRFGLSLEDIRRFLELYGRDEANLAQLGHGIELGRQRLAAMRQERAALDAAIAELDNDLACAEQEYRRLDQCRATG